MFKNPKEYAAELVEVYFAGNAEAATKAFEENLQSKVWGPIGPKSQWAKDVLDALGEISTKPNEHAIAAHNCRRGAEAHARMAQEAAEAGDAGLATMQATEASNLASEAQTAAAIFEEENGAGREPSEVDQDAIAAAKAASAAWAAVADAMA